MDHGRKHPAGILVAATAELLVLAGVLPFLGAFVLGYSPAAVAALVASAFIIEYGAAPVGLALGLSPLYVLVVLCSVALGVTLFLFGIIDAAGEHSERVQRFLAWSAEKGRKSRILARYGIYGLIPCVITLGFYVCPPVAGVFGWRRDLSVLMIMAGFAGIAIAMILLTAGIFDLFLRQVP